MIRDRAVLALLLAMALVGSGLGLDSAAVAVAPPPVSERPVAPTVAPEAVVEVEAPTLEQLIGQKLMVTMAGTKPTKAMLRRVKRGEVGGIILLGRNVTSKAQLQRLTLQLQRAAADGGQPPLLISIDQEGGTVKRVPWAPPTITVPEMGRIGSSKVARAQGRATGKALRNVGINVDLAPVADVPISNASFMLQQGRTFSRDAATTARLSNAFADGLKGAGVMPTMKHFPGIGRATQNTDRFVDTITASKRTLRADLRPYRQAIRGGIPLIMLSNATFTAYDDKNAAGWSRRIAERLLRRELGFTGVSVTDSLNGTANARGTTVRKLGFRAAKAGADMLLVTGSEGASDWLYRRLLDDARRGRLPESTLRASYDRILALKERLPGRSRR